MTNIDPNTLGHDEATGNFITAYGTFTEVEGDTYGPNECLVTDGKNGKEYYISNMGTWTYNSQGVVLGYELPFE